jgi:hypothetical protein
MGRTAPTPGGETLHAEPSPHVQPARADARQRRRRVTSRHGGAVNPRHPRPGAAPLNMWSVAYPLARSHHRQPHCAGRALGEHPQVRCALAVTRASLLGIHVLEGHRLGQGTAGLCTLLAAECLRTRGLIVLATVMTEARPRHRGACPSAHGPHARHPGLPRHVADDMLALEVHRRQSLVQRLDVLARGGGARTGSAAVAACVGLWSPPSSQGTPIAAVGAGAAEWQDSSTRDQVNACHHWCRHELPGPTADTGTQHPALYGLIRPTALAYVDTGGCAPVPCRCPAA